MWLKNWIKRYPLIAYFTAVFGIELLIVFFLATRMPTMIVLLIGSWLPNIVGVLVTGVAGGRTGLKRLLNKIVLWRIGFKWYVIALFMPMGVAFLAISLNKFIGGTRTDFAPVGQIVPIVLIAVFTGALGEELGWRGTALPLLQSRWNALVSSLILGVLWGLFHLPSFFLSGMPLQDVPFIPFIVMSVGSTFLITWVFNHTNGSLIPVFLFHFAFNFIGNITGIFGDPSSPWLLAGIYSVTAILVASFSWASFAQPANASSIG